MRVAIVIGTHGQVGQALIAELRAQAWEQIVCTSRQFSERTESANQYPLDLQNAASIKRTFAKFSQRFPSSEHQVSVFLTGALTHVDKCEQEPKLANAMNADGPMTVTDECIRLGYKLIFYSSEYVFGGAEYEGGAVGPFTEEDPVFPTSVYGKNKLAVEKKLLSLIDEGLPSKNALPLIIRTTMVFSYEPQGMNFVMQVRRQLAAESVANPFRIPEDQISTPTYAPDLARASLQLVEKNISGIFHIVGKDLFSRKEFVFKIAQAYGYSKELVEKRFQFVKTADLGQSARRPLTAGLRTDAAERLGIRIGTWAESVTDMQSRERK
jgi:dTDP-4-dehydrorhamnose reductase